MTPEISRFEAHPDPQFVFTKSAQCLYYFVVPIAMINMCASDDDAADITEKIQRGWETLDG